MRKASIARATSRRRGFGNFRTSRPKDSKRSTCKVGLEIAAISLDLASLSFAIDLSIRAFHKAVQFLFGHAVLANGVIVGVNGDGAESDDFAAMKNADVFALGSPFQKRGKIYAGLRRRKRGRASILRRYSEQLKRRKSPKLVFDENDFEFQTRPGSENAARAETNH